jgi:tetratricopeptide (TPR) repeat protein
MNALVNTDFGLFIFAPDDILKLREKENKTVRDNVVFELGLFLGYLGKDRCFILVPDNRKGFRIPTDLAELTPAEYETNRKDGNLQAATGPGCTSIRERIVKLGSRSIAERLPSELAKTTQQDNIVSSVHSESKTENTSNPDLQWIGPFVNADYPTARTLLQKTIAETKDTGLLPFLKSWLGSIEYRLNPRIGTELLQNLITENPSNYVPYLRLADEHKESRRYDECLKVLELGISQATDKVQLINLKASCLTEIGREPEALKALQNATEAYKDDPEAFQCLAQHYVDNKSFTEARGCLEKGLDSFQNNEPLLRTYANLLKEHFDGKLALVPYNTLISLSPKDSTYLTLRANIYLELELHDLAMHDYRRASELAEEKTAWIIANIGNLQKNRGFFSDAINTLQKALVLDPSHQYAHERLASSISLHKDEIAKLSEIMKTAKKDLFTSRVYVKGTP